jgi:hypothetical protein
MESYKLWIAFQAMEEGAERRTTRRANTAPAFRGAADLRRAASVQRGESSRFDRLGTALGGAAAWMHGRALVLPGERRVSTAPSLGLD